ncbi:MAG: response regulator [Nitrospirae bacterium]|nr:response regulator [Nitrospirota bacterium]MBF0541227.1 response regulator [Nitrospirota bacterium]
MVTIEKQDIKNINVLIVEDDEGHVRLIEKNLRHAGLIGQISVANTDFKALSMLTEESSHDHQNNSNTIQNEETPIISTKNVKPLLVLLDLNIPEKGGYDVLRQILTNRAKIKTMVVVFSASSDPVEIKNCYQLGCNIFISKPLEYDRFAETIRSLGAFLRYIKFP